MNKVIDFHTHVLPAIDDGSKSLEQSIAMLQKIKEQGIRRVIATPHFYAQYDKPEKFLKKRAEAEALLRAEMAHHPEMPELSIGAEVYYFHGICDSDVLSELTIDKKGFILIEMPMPPWSERVYRDLENIMIKQNLIPIVAHIDRYIAPFQTYKIPERLAHMPVMIQANASFFLEKATRRMAMGMLKKGKIHLLGSDCHNLTDRSPNLGDAVSLITQKLGQDAISYICTQQDEVFEVL